MTYHKEFPRDVSRQNLRTMIERFRPGGTRVVLAGGRFPYVDDLAKELKVPVIPFLDGVQGHPELFISDGAHPTGEGYSIVVRNILRVSSRSSTKRIKLPLKVPDWSVSLLIPIGFARIPACHGVQNLRIARLLKIFE